MKYRDRLIGDFRLDLLIEKSVVLELKCVGKLDPIFEAQLLTRLRISGMKKALLINFNSRLLKDGIKRLVF
jgi:GxxExxY protein